MLFKALHTLAGKCPAIIVTVAREGERLRVNVMPKAKESKEVDEDEAALFTPVSVVGTPEELETGFADALATYGEARADLAAAIGEATANIKAATAAKTPPKPTPKPAVAPAAPVENSPAADDAAPAAAAKPKVHRPKFTPARPAVSASGQNFSIDSLFSLGTATADQPQAE